MKQPRATDTARGGSLFFFFGTSAGHRTSWMLFDSLTAQSTLEAMQQKGGLLRTRVLERITKDTRRDHDPSTPISLIAFVSVCRMPCKEVLLPLKLISQRVFFIEGIYLVVMNISSSTSLTILILEQTSCKWWWLYLFFEIWRLKSFFFFLNFVLTYSSTYLPLSHDITFSSLFWTIIQPQHP